METLTIDKQKEQQIFNAFNQTMYEYTFRYADDPTNNVYKNWLTESQFKSCYKNAIVISKIC